jgi:hypothetical protein
MKAESVFQALSYVEDIENVLGERTESLVQLASELESILENFPINADTSVKHAMYFVMIANEWWPCVGNEQPNGWLEYRIDMLDGSSESGVSRPRRWAHINADGVPNYSYFEKEGAKP